MASAQEELVANAIIPTGLVVLAGLTLAATRAPTDWYGSFKASDGSGLQGSARVEAVGKDSSRVQIEVTGAKSGSQLPWHIHSGACGAKGAVFGDARAYPLLRVDSYGKASSQATLPLPAPSSGSYAVMVHRSASDMSPVACGALKPEASTPSYPQRDTAGYRP
jgi:hypothetical protein